MTDQETINVNLQRQIDMQNSRIDRVSASVEALVQELREFKNETREQNRMRAEENSILRAESDARIGRIEVKLDGIGNHVRNMGIMTLIGIAAMVIAVILK